MLSMGIRPGDSLLPSLRSVEKHQHTWPPRSIVNVVGMFVHIESGFAYLSIVTLRSELIFNSPNFAKGSYAEGGAAS